MKHARSDYNRIQDPDHQIGDDEPVFLMRATDTCAPLVVDIWAALAEAEGADDKIVSAAREQAKSMRRWQAEHGCKIPDMPEGSS